MTRRFVLFVLFPCAFLFLGASCTDQQNGTTKLPGSVFRSPDDGGSWVSKSFLTDEKGQKVHLANIEVTKLLINPKNSQTLFMGTRQNGLFVSDSTGDNWKQLISNQEVVDLTLDYAQSCLLFVTTPHRVFRTQDCGQNWTVLFLESREDVILTSLAIDRAQGDIFYLATTSGELLKSTDKGKSWQLQFTSPGKTFVKIVPDLYDASVLFLVSHDGTIYKTKNHGVTWTLISDGLKQFSNASKGFRGALSLHGRNGLLYITQDSIFRTYDGGNVWEQIKFITLPQSVRIVTATVNPANDAEIIYASSNTMYHTYDGGQHWITRPLPSKRAPSLFVFDENNPKVLYYGAKSEEEEKSPYWQ